MASRDFYALRELELHGHRVAYRQAGSGPVLVLIHGITSNSGTWRRVMPRLAERFTVLAPDLAGHGSSAKPRGDYSLGAYASGVRDLLLALGHERATIVGHSLGGGVAMQLAYQYPERCERLVLVDSGGLGREVSLLLRAATLPGAELVLPLLAHRRLIDAVGGFSEVFARRGLRVRTDLLEIARGHASLSDFGTRQAFLHTLRAIVEPGGQRVSAQDRLYLAEAVPVLVVWGAKDRVIPVEHSETVREEVPTSRLEVVPDAGHFPQLDRPDRFVEILLDFIATTEPARHDTARLGELLRELNPSPAEKGS